MSNLEQSVMTTHSQGLHLKCCNKCFFFSCVRRYFTPQLITVKYLQDTVCLCQQTKSYHTVGRKRAWNECFLSLTDTYSKQVNLETLSSYIWETIIRKLIPHKRDIKSLSCWAAGSNTTIVNTLTLTNQNAIA